jgi:hypothetical protein
MSMRPYVLAAAVAAAAALTPVLTSRPLLAKDDPAAQAAAKEAVKKDLKEKKFFYTFDLSYSVDSAKLKESRWSWKDPPFPGAMEKQDLQFAATLASDSGEQWVRLLIWKMPHFERNGNQQSNFTHEFKSWGKTVPVSKTGDMAEGYYENWIREATDVIKDKCKATKKRALGPGEYYATAVGTGTEEEDQKKRVRKIWVLWGTTGAGTPCTWLAQATIAEKFIDTEEIIKKAEDMIGGLKEIKDPRLK